MIQELQAEGFNLKGIERLLEQSPGPAEQFLSFKRALGASFETEEPQTFTREELTERFGGDDEGETLKRAVESGALIPIGEDRFEARVPSLLDAAEGVIAQGVPLDHALAVLAKVQDRCKSVAREFVRLFLEDVWKPFEEAGYPDDRWPEVRAALDAAAPALGAGADGHLPDDHVRRGRLGLRQAARAALQGQEVAGPATPPGARRGCSRTGP